MGSESPPDCKYGSFRSTRSRLFSGNSLYEGIGIFTESKDVFLTFILYIIVSVLVISCEIDKH